MWRWLPAALAVAVFVGGLAGCGGSRHAARPDDKAVAGPGMMPVRHDPPRPVSPGIASLPNARGFWLTDEEYGQVYVVTVGPAGQPTEPPLFLVHGLGTEGMRDWYMVLAPLVQHRRVVMFDLPGCGRSGHANVKYAPARYAAVMSRVIAAYGPGPVDV